MLVIVAAGIAFVALLIAALRKRVDVAIGIAIGLAVAGAAAAVVPDIHLQTIPPWLPALPFACVALTLFFFGALAWWWESDR